MMTRILRTGKTTTLLVIGLLVLSLSACSVDDGADPITYGVIPILEIESETSVVVLQQLEIDLTYEVDTSCQTYSSYDPTGTGFERTIVLISRELDEPCEEVIEEQQVTVIFEPQQVGEYTFRFGTELNEDGSIGYTERTITVEPN